MSSPGTWRTCVMPSSAPAGAGSRPSFCPVVGSGSLELAALPEVPGSCLLPGDTDVALPPWWVSYPAVSGCPCLCLPSPLSALAAAFALAASSF
eukprot:6490384-Amphidinium_carterae.2